MPLISVEMVYVVPFSIEISSLNENTVVELDTFPLNALVS